MAPFGCRHFLLSEVLSAKAEGKDLSLRLTDGNATLLMSVYILILCGETLLSITVPIDFQPFLSSAAAPLLDQHFESGGRQ